MLPRDVDPTPVKHVDQLTDLHPLFQEGGGLLDTETELPQRDDAGQPGQLLGSVETVAVGRTQPENAG